MTTMSVVGECFFWYRLTWVVPDKVTHTHTTVLRLWILSGTTRGSRYQKKYSPTHTHCGHQISLSASSIYYDPCILSIQSTHFTVFFHNLSPSFFGLPVGLAPSTSYSIHFFTQALSSFHSTCPYHCNLFCCSTEIMSSNPSLSLNSLLRTLKCYAILNMNIQCFLYFSRILTF